jgi:hypothetical protein
LTYAEGRRSSGVGPLVRGVAVGSVEVPCTSAFPRKPNAFEQIATGKVATDRGRDTSIGWMLRVSRWRFATRRCFLLLSTTAGRPKAMSYSSLESGYRRRGQRHLRGKNARDSGRRRAGKNGRASQDAAFRPALETVTNSSFGQFCYLLLTFPDASYRCASPLNPQLPKRSR